MSVERSGDIFGEAISGSIHLNTVSGDIKLSKSDVPALRGKTVRGDLLVETPLGDGSLDIHHNNVSGDILLASEIGVGTFQDEPEMEIIEEPFQMRSDILDQVGRGELSVDQALQLLVGDSNT